MSILLKFACCDCSFSVVLEDDGRTCYAYLLANGEVVSDVWLYNTISAPATPQWPDRNKMPYLNPLGFVSVEQFIPIVDEADVAIEWLNTVASAEATIYLRGEKHARLKSGVKPGWCRLAIKENSIAKPLQSP